MVMFDERKGDQSDDSSDDEQKSGSDDSSSDDSSSDERKVGKARKSVKLHLNEKSTKKTRPISSKDETPRTKQPTDLSKKRLIDHVDDTTTIDNTPRIEPERANTFDNSDFEFASAPAAHSTQNRNESQNESQNGAGSQNNSQLSRYQNRLHKWLTKNKDGVAIDFKYTDEEGFIEEPKRKGQKLKLKFNPDPNTDAIITTSKDADSKGSKARNLTKTEFRKRLENYPESFELRLLGVSTVAKLQTRYPMPAMTDHKAFKNLEHEKWFLQIVQTKLIDEDRVEGDHTEQILQPVTGNT